MTVVALLLTACGGSGTVQDETAAVESSDESVARLIRQFGSDQAAADALIIAMDRGYLTPQLLDAVDSDNLRSDGTIQDQEPAGRPLGLVLYSLEGEGEGALSSQAESTQLGEVRLLAFAQTQQTPIEQLREDSNGSWSNGVGTTATALILHLLMEEFAAADIIEVLILGIDSLDVDHPFYTGIACVQVVDELYCPGGERFPVLPEPDEADPAPESVTADSILDDVLEGSEPQIEGDRLRFRGSLAEALLGPDESNDAGRVLIDSIDLVVTLGEVTAFEGRATFLAEVDAEGTDVLAGSCIWLEHVFERTEALDVTGFTGITPTFEFAGESSLTGAFADGVCPDGGPPPAGDTFVLTFTATLTDLTEFVIETLDENGESTTLVATFSDN